MEALEAEYVRRAGAAPGPEEAAGGEGIRGFKPQEVLVFAVLITITIITITITITITINIFIIFIIIIIIIFFVQRCASNRAAP